MMVYYSTNGNAYIAKQATTGNAPTSEPYWSQFAAGSGGIWNAGLSLVRLDNSCKFWSHSIRICNNRKWWIIKNCF